MFAGLLVTNKEANQLLKFVRGIPLLSVSTIYTINGRLTDKVGFLQQRCSAKN